MSPRTPTRGTAVTVLDSSQLSFSASTPIDERIAEVAEAQHGSISLDQLRACGISASAVRSRVAAGRLRRLHRGVFAPGHHRLPPHGPLAAAVLAYPRGTAISHLSAADLHGLRKDRRHLIDVTVTGAARHRHSRVRVHRTLLDAIGETTRCGIPTTGLARTILDCSAELDPRAIERMCGEAELLGRFDLVALETLAETARGHPGVGTLRTVLGNLGHGAALTESDLEEVLLLAFREAGLPQPECQATIQLLDGSYVRPDFLWRRAQLVVEADGRRYHDRLSAYRRDRSRDLALLRLGYATVRFSDLDARDPAACAAAVAELLRKRNP